jgi:hypothetical protein
MMNVPGSSCSARIRQPERTRDSGDARQHPGRNDELISKGRVVDDLVPRPSQRFSQPAHVLPDRVGGRRLFRFVIEFSLDPIVVDHVTSMSVEESEEPPEVGRQATWLTGDQHEMPSPVNVPGLVEIVGKRDLLTASVA